MARQYKTGLIITGDAKGGIRAIQATEKELGQLNKGFDRSSQRSKKFASNAGGVSRELSVLRRAAAPVGAALAGMFAVSTLQQQIDFGDQLQKTNLRIGASTEALSQYNYVASLSGVQFKELATAWQRQSRRVAQAANDTGEAQQALATLNLDAKALAQLAPEDQFERIAAAMNGVASEAQRVALAQKIWDSEGVKLLQIVNQGTDAIARMRAEADSLGLTISQETANDMATFNDEVAKLSFAAKGVSQTLLSEIVPAMTDGMQATSAFIAEMGGAEEVLGRVGQVASTLATVYLAKRIGPGLTKIGGQGLVAGRTIASGMAIAAGSTGPLNRALVITQGRIAATAAAGRAMSASLTLLGGPGGAAILAGGAIYYFREELGLVPPPVRSASDELDTLRTRLNDVSEATIKYSVAGFTAELFQLQVQAQQAAERLETLKEAQRSPNSYGQGMRGDLSAGIMEQEAALESLNNQIESRQEAVSQLTAKMAELNTTASDGKSIFRTLDEWLFDVPESTERVSSVAQEAARAADNFANSLTSLEDQLFPVEKAQRDFAQSQVLLQTALMKGEISIGRYLAAFDRLEQSALSDKNWQDAYDSIGQVNKELARGNEFAKEFGGTMSSALEDAILNFENLGGVAEGFFKDLQRMIIRQTFTDPMARSVEDGLSGFSWGDIGSTIGSMFGGGAGAFSSSYGASSAGSFAGFDQGGYTGPGGKNDPAGIVHAGEFVVKKSVVEKSGVRPMLERLNSMPGYAAGGYVGAASKGAAPAGGGEIKVIYSPTIQVEAQPGATEQDGQRLAKGLDQTIRGRFYELIAKESRPGGVLYKQR